MGKTVLRFGKFSIIILLNVLHILLPCNSSPSSIPDIQVWCFDGVGEFLNIPFTAVELFD
jgi:hypothetical protein